MCEQIVKGMSNPSTREEIVIAAEGVDVYQGLTTATMELMVNVGLMDSVSGHWPEAVQEAWAERIREMTTWMGQQVSEVQEFASSYD